MAIRSHLLKLRKEQMEALRHSASRNFEDRISRHLNRFFPAQCGKSGAEETLREAIRYGIKQAKDYGIVTQRGICKYLNVMFVFGRDFDKNPDFPWASKILQNPSSQSPDWIVKDLYDAAIKNADKGRGYHAQRKG